MEDRVGRDGEAARWAADATPASAKSYFLRVLKAASGSIRNARELETLCVILDHLALGRFREAADVVAMRMKAVEMAAKDGDWSRAIFLELVESDGTTLATKEEEMATTEEMKMRRRLQSNSGGGGKGKASKGEWRSYGSDSTVYGKGSGKAYGGKDKDKNKGKGKKGYDSMRNRSEDDTWNRWG